jgi:hypothetical protein
MTDEPTPINRRVWCDTSDSAIWLWVQNLLLSVGFALLVVPYCGWRLLTAVADRITYGRSGMTRDDEISWVELAVSMVLMIALGVGLLGLAAIAWAVWGGQ